MWILVLGLAFFFVPHLLKLLLPRQRAAFIAARGEGPWKGMVALPSLVGIGLMIWGWMSWRSEAPDIYVPPEWGVHATAVLALIGFILMGVANGPVGRIKALIHHPMSIGVAAWSIGHLCSNGDLASILLFGSWAVYAIAAAIGAELRGDPAPVFASSRPDITGTVAGIVLYLVFVLFLHGLLFSVAPPLI